MKNKETLIVLASWLFAAILIVVLAILIGSSGCANLQIGIGEKTTKQFIIINRTNSPFEYCLFCIDHPYINQHPDPMVLIKGVLDPKDMIKYNTDYGFGRYSLNLRNVDTKEPLTLQFKASKITETIFITEVGHEEKYNPNKDYSKKGV